MKFDIGIKRSLEVYMATKDGESIVSWYTILLMLLLLKFSKICNKYCNSFVSDV